MPSLLKSAQPVVFLPGWAFSGMILALADKPLGWLAMDVPLDPASALTDLSVFLDSQALDRVHLVGWSMGGNLALDFAATNPARIAGLTLLGVRAAWPVEEIAAIRAGLNQEPEDFLRDFHRKCFLGSRGAYRRFVALQQEALLQALDLPLLERGLNYLADWRLPRIIPECPIVCGHSRKDVVAPLAFRLRIPGAQVKLAGHGGHTFFLDEKNKIDA